MSQRITVLSTGGSGGRMFGGLEVKLLTVECMYGQIKYQSDICLSFCANYSISLKLDCKLQVSEFLKLLPVPFLAHDLGYEPFHAVKPG